MSAQMMTFPDVVSVVRWSTWWLLPVICMGSVSRGQSSSKPSLSGQELINAVIQQDETVIAELLALNVDVNAPQADGATALHWAVYQDDIGTVRRLIRAGASLDATNELGVMALSLACTNANPVMVRMLLKAGANSNATRTTGVTPLMTAARTGNIDAVGALLTYGADVNTKERSRHQTALMWAISETHSHVASRLVDHGADIHTITKSGFTPLLFAARVGDLATAKLLIDAGADVNVTAKDGNSVLHIATVQGHTEVAALLLDRGVNPNADGPGYTPLHWAVGTWETELTGKYGIVTPPDHPWSKMTGVQEGKLQLVQKLLEHGADPNARLQKNPRRYGFTGRSTRPKGSTPMVLAALAGEVKVMRMLADHGADVSLAAENGVTPLMMAAGVRRPLFEAFITNSDSLEAVKVALELGAAVNAVDDIGDTALHGAAHIKSVELIEVLVDAGAKVNVVNKRGQTPLYIANHYWHPFNPLPPEHTPSAAGELLRKLSIPNVVSNTLREWGTLSADTRKRVESLLQAELEGIADELERRKQAPTLPMVK